MRSPLLVSSLIAVFVSTAPPSTGARCPSSNEAVDDVHLDPATVSFGRMLVGQTVRRTLTLRNDGQSELNLERLTAPESVVLALAADGLFRVPIGADGSIDVTLDPGEEAKLTLTLGSRGLGPQHWSQSLAVAFAGVDEPLLVPLEAELIGARPSPAPAPTGRNQPPAPKRTGPLPKLISDAPVAELGTLAVGERVSHEFQFRNDGEAPLEIRGVRSSCKCASRRLWSGDFEVPEEKLSVARPTDPVLVLKPGEVAHLEVELETRDQVPRSDGRPIEKAITLLSDDPDRPSFPFRLRYGLEHILRLDPIRLAFPEGRRGEEIAGELSVTSVNGEPVTLTGFELVEDPRVPSTPLEITVDTEGAAAVEHSVRVVVPATTPAGRINSQVVLRFDHPRVQELSFRAFGQVLSQVQFQVEPIDEARRTVILDFGVMDGSEDVTRTLSVVNHDPSIPYVPTSVEIVSRRGLEQMSYELEEVRAGIEYRVHVTVAKEIEHRFFAGSLQMRSEHPDEELHMVSIRGFMERKNEAVTVGGDGRPDSAGPER